MIHDLKSTEREATLTRDLPALTERILIIGFDGATFDVLTPMMDQGRMPHLKAFIERGTSGAMESTKPPITPAAWTTFMTGKNPGGHGILDFERYDVRTNRLSFNTTQSIRHVRTMWDVLGQKGLRVGLVNVPMTYPPPRVNGFAVSGFETPGTAAEFTHPAELKDELLRRWPGYTFKSNWERRWLGGDRLFAQNLRRICDSFHQGADVTRFCGDRYGWDALMVVFKLVDNLQHKTWKYLDPRFNAGHARRTQMVARCFNELDDAFGTLVEYADKNAAAVFVMSDHGHGSLIGKAQPNLLLRDWGYLQLQSGGAQSQTRLRYVLDRAMRRPKGRFARQDQVTRDLAIDFSRTRACVMHAGMYGFLYVNLKGRQPDGIVETGEYESLRDQLHDRLLATRVRRPNGETTQLFQEVHKPESLYDCSRSDAEWMPDLMLVPAEGLSVVRKIRGHHPVIWLPWRKIEGTHRLDGMFAAAGPGIASNRTLRTRIVDAAPTVLAMLGMRIPADMHGQVITDMFEKPIHHQRTAATETAHLQPQQPVFSAEEERLLTERLADLGYLE